MKIIFIGFLLRFLFSYLNTLFGPFSGAEYDAIVFHNEAVHFTEYLEFSDKLGWIYADIIGIIYLLSFKSIFIGSLVSIFAWTVSAIVILKLLKKFNFENKTINIILIAYVFLPSSIFITSITLREATILLFINLIALSFAKYELENRIFNIFVVLILFIVLIFFHKAYVLNAAFIVPLLLLIMLFSINNRLLFYLACLSLILISFPLLRYINDILISKDIYDTSTIFYDNISNFRSNLTISRATYEINYEINNFIDFLFFAPVTFFKYLFEPMPWKISSIRDGILFLENFLRLILIYLVIIKLQKINYKSFYFLLFFYILTELIFAFGTSNWGTAARHHLPSYGILLLIAFFPNYKIKSYNNKHQQNSRI